MVEVLSSKVVTTRTPHNCWGCGNPIPVGTKVQCVTGVDDSRIGSVYWCDNCKVFMQTLDHWDTENGFCYGELKDMDGYPVKTKAE